MELLGLECFGQRPKKAEEISGEKAGRQRWKRWNTISILRFWFIAVFLYHCTLRCSTWQGGYRPTQEDCGSRRRCPCGSAKATSPRGGGDGIRPVETATEAPQPDPKNPDSDWKKGNGSATKGATNAAVHPANPTACGFGKTATQEGGRADSVRNSRFETAVAESQGWKIDRRHQRGRDRRCLHGGRGEDRTQETARRSQSRTSIYAPTGRLHATTDGHLHADIQCHHEESARVGAAKCSFTKDTKSTGEGAHQHDGRWAGSPKGGNDKRCKSPIWGTGTVQSSERSCLALCGPQRTRLWDGLVHLGQREGDRDDHDLQGDYHNAQDEPSKIQSDNSNGHQTEAFDVKQALIAGGSFSLLVYIVFGIWGPTTCTTTRTRAKTWSRILIIAALLHGSVASEDERVVGAFRARRQADALQPDLTFHNSWQWIYQHLGLRPPGRDLPYTTLIHRPDDVPMPTPGAVRLQVHFRRNALTYATDLERLWTDLGPIIGGGRTWTVREMQRVLHPTSLLQHDISHYMLSTIADDQRRPQQVPIFFEVEWIQDETHHRGYTKPWVDKRTTVVGFMQQQGLLAQCTTTHRCDILRNGRRQQFALMILDKADYILLIGKPFRPHSDSEDDTHEPGACMLATREHTPSSFTTSSESPDDDGDQLSASETEAGAISNFPIWATAIFRANLGLGSPPFMHSTHGEGSRQWIQDVYQTWPRLRYARWSHHKVHHSFQRDYPQGDLIEHRVLVTLTDLPSTFHQVTLIAGNYGEASFFQAWPFPPYVDPFIVLDEIGIWDLCQHELGSCKVYLNGLAMDLRRRSAITHGDYILVRIRGGRDPTTRSRVARAFGVPDSQQGHEYATAMGAARIGGDGASAASTEIVPFHSLPHGRQTRLHEGYWLVMALFAWTAGFLLLRLQLVCDKRRPTIGYKVGRTRTCRRRCFHWTRPPWIMLWLVATQNLGQVTTSLSIPSVGSEETVGHENPVANSRTIAPGYWRQTGHHVTLPPPGNTAKRSSADCTQDGPLQIDNFLIDNCTTSAENLRQQIVTLTEAQQIRTKTDISNIDDDTSHLDEHQLHEQLTEQGRWMMRQIVLLCETKHLQFQLASLAKVLRSKVDYDTKFVYCRNDKAVRSTLVGKANMPTPTVFLPERPEESDCGRFERVLAVDRTTSPQVDTTMMPTVHLPIAMTQEKATQVVIGVGNAPNKHRHVFHIDADVDVMDDRHGLSNAWHMEPMPPLMDLDLDYHPDSYAALVDEQEILNVEYSDLYIYTDGSAGLYEDQYLSTWAFVVFEGPSDDTNPKTMRILEWAADLTDTDPLSPTWLGATQYSIRAGEAEAIAWAILWAIQSNDSRPIHLGSDALTVLHATTGRWGYHPDDGLLMRVRATYQLLWSIRQGDSLYTSHIKGHSGHYGNELADTIAKAVRTGRLQGRKPDVNLAHWFHGTNPHILWAWMPFDIDHKATSMPVFANKVISGQGLSAPDPSLSWLPTVYRAPQDDHIGWLCMKVGTYNVSSIKEMGRAALLREQAEYHGFHVIGLQETRTVLDDPCDSNFVRIISASQQGVGGCELWLATTQPYGWTGDTPCYFQRQHVQVVHADEQILIATYHQGPLHLLFCVAHAPHSGKGSTILQHWWTRLTTLLQRYVKNNHLIMMIDANADPEPWMDAIGELQPFSRDKQRQSDLLFSKLIQQFSLMLPSTFEDFHRSDISTTWRSNDGRYQARNDYVAIPSTWRDFTINSELCEGMDSGAAGLDHVAVSLLVKGAISLQPPRSNLRTFDRHRILTAHEEDITQCLQQMKDIPWSTDVTTHAAQIEEFIGEILTTLFPSSQSKKKRSRIFTDTTWDVITKRNRLKKVLACHHKAERQLTMNIALHAWYRDDSLSLYRYSLLVYALKISSTWKHHQAAAKELKQSIRQDRGNYVQKMVNHIDFKNTKSLLADLKPLKMGKRVANLGRRAIPIVLKLDGTPAEDPQQARDRWRQHFAQMEGGRDVSLEELLSRQPQCDTVEEITLADMPSLCELESAMRHSTPGKSMGFDQIPPELLHRFPVQMARLTWTLFLKQTIFCCESLQHKGGRLIAAYKRRGDSRLCTSYRSLLVSSSLGKSFHTVYRRRLMPHLHQTATSLQYTSHRSPHVTQASHTVRSFLEHHCRQGRSAFAIFVDIKEAYYRLIRQNAINATCSDEDVMTFLRRMDVHLHIDQVAALMSQAPAIEELGTRPHLSRMVSEIHRDTWFVVQNDDRPVLTERGTRPGDAFADVLWALVFQKWLSRMEQDLYDMEILHDYPWNGMPGVLAGKGSCMVHQGVVAWADDVAILVDTHDAELLQGKMVATAELMIHRLLSFGMMPNMGQGKTEAIATPRGRHALKVRRELFNQQKGLLQLNTSMEDQVFLRLVPRYKHLGSYIVHGAHNRPELLHRLAQGQQSMKAYRNKLYSNTSVPLKQRIEIMRATAMTATMYNMSSMGPLNKKDQKLWHHGVLTMYRRLMYRLFPYNDIRHMTDTQVLCLVQQLSPAEELRVARLRAFGQYAQRDNDFHWSILGLEEKWLEQIKDDLGWMYSYIAGLTCHTRPLDDWEHWYEFSRHHPKKWKRLLKRVATTAILQRKLRAEVHDGQKQILTLLGQHGVPILMTEHTQRTEDFYCTICDKDFSSYRGWAVHAFKAHGRVHPFRQLQKGDTCAACGHQFPTEARLARHFKNSAKCAATVAAQQWWTPIEPSFGSKKVREEETAALLRPWDVTDKTSLGQRHGWPMTIQTRRFLQTACKCQWTNRDSDLELLRGALRTEAVSVYEIAEVRDGMLHYYDNEGIGDNIRQSFQVLLDEARTEATTTTKDADVDTQLQQHSQVPIYTVNTVPRLRLRHRYVLHLYSGVKRQNDLHSQLLDVGRDEGIALFPISLDIVLSKEHGDLLDRRTQDYWADLSLRGGIHFAFGGPPCETWSVSRWRHYDTQTGPRPLRSGDDILSEIWGWRVLKVKEILQLLCANQLLLYMLRIFVCQLCSGGGALVEHPAQPPPRHGHQPASIWLLPLIRILLQCKQVSMIQIQQGFWSAVSPKPTTFLITTPKGSGPEYQTCLKKFQTRTTLPPPLRMGKKGGIFNTAQLKRYPGPLCSGLASIAVELAKQMTHPQGTDEINQEQQNLVNPILEVATTLRVAYNMSEMDAVDGHDYCKLNGTTLN